MRFLDLNSIDTDKSSKTVEIIGIVVYVLIFLLTIPYYLYHKSPLFFPYYIINVDILATILTTIKHPSIFKGLYKASPETIVEYLSIIIINLVVLTFLISFSIDNAKKFGKNKAVLIGALTVVLTFMIPTYIIPFFENDAKPYIQSLTDNRNIQLILEYVLGIALGLGFIFLEKTLIEKLIL